MNEKEQMLTKILNCRRVDLYTEKRELSNEEQKKYNEMESRLQDGEPLQYILGECDFMGTKLFVNDDVLIPRPETEILVELALETANSMRARPMRILDLGTGSGNIAITLAKKFKKSRITAVDVSKEALKLARFNAKENKVAEKINFIWADMAQFLELGESIHKRFDIIISNPPYIKSKDIENLPKDVQREPLLALDGGEDGLSFYREIIANSKYYLEKEGYLILEIGEDQAEMIKEIFKSHPRFTNIRVHKDYTDQDRIVIAQLSTREAILN